MTTLSLFIFLNLAFFTSGISTARAEIVDTYANYQHLAAHEKIDVAYSIEAVNQKKSKRTVFAIHAGNIEPGTGELTQAVAAQDLNYYIFTAIEATHPLRLHLTSTHFDEPKALALAATSQQCISLHGYEYHTSEVKVCVGGADLGLKKKFMASTPPSGVSLIACSGKLAGTAKANIVNRCEHKGVQLELSRELRDRVKSDAVFKASMAAWIRSIF